MHNNAAIALSMVMAVPGVLAVLFLGIVLTTKSRWN